MFCKSIVLTILIVSTLASSAAMSQKAPYVGTATELAGFALAYERSSTSGGAVTAAVLEDIGYFKGFVTGVFVSRTWPCAREMINLEQVWAVVAKYIRENPERWAVQSRDLVLEGAERVWGCKSPTAK